MADIYEETRCEIVALQPRYQIWHALEQSLFILCLIFLMHPLGVLQYFCGVRIKDKLTEHIICYDLAQKMFDLPQTFQPRLTPYRPSIARILTIYHISTSTGSVNL